MATEKQIAANKANALKSTGPKSSEGKAIVAKNAVKFGLFSEGILLFEEKLEDFEEFSNDFKSSLCPEGALENLIFDRAICLAWRLSRIGKIERDLLEVGRGSLLSLYTLKEAGVPISGTGLGFGFSGNQEALDKLPRYESFLQRSFYKSLEELEKLQANRLLRNERKISLLKDKQAQLEGFESFSESES